MIRQARRRHRAGAAPSLLDTRGALKLRLFYCSAKREAESAFATIGAGADRLLSPYLHGQSPRIEEDPPHRLQCRGEASKQRQHLRQPPSRTPTNRPFSRLVHALSYAGWRDELWTRFELCLSRRLEALAIISVALSQCQSRVLHAECAADSPARARRRSSRRRGCNRQTPTPPPRSQGTCRASPVQTRNRRLAPVVTWQQVVITWQEGECLRPAMHH